MAVPQYQSNVVRIAGGMPGILTDPSPLAEGLGAVSTMIATRTERLRRSDEEDRNTSMEADFSRKRADAYALRGKNALNLVDDADAGYENLYKSTVDNIEDPITKENMDIRFRKSFEAHRNRLLSHQMREEDEHLKDSDITNRAGDLKGLATAESAYDMEAIDAAVDARADATAIIQGPERWSSDHDVAYRQSTADEYYTALVDQWYRDNPEKTYNWFERNKKVLKEKLSPTAFAALSKKQEAERPRAEVARIYRVTNERFDGDNLKASTFLRDPDNHKKIGVSDRDYGLALQASNRFSAEYNANKAMEDAQKKVTSDQLIQNYTTSKAQISAMKDPRERMAALRALYHDIQTNPDLDLASQKALLASVYEANYYKDPQAVAQLNKMIDTGQITDPSIPRLLLGQGIGDSADEYVKRIQKVQDDRNKSNINFSKEASAAYVAAGKDKELLGRFKLRLEAERIKGDGEGNSYSVYDPVMLEIGEQIMAKEWYKETEPGEPEQVWKDEPYWTWNKEERFGFQETPSDIQDIYDQMRTNVYQGQPAAAQVPSPAAGGAPRVQPGPAGQPAVAAAPPLSEEQSRGAMTATGSTPSPMSEEQARASTPEQEGAAATAMEAEMAAAQGPLPGETDTPEQRALAVDEEEMARVEAARVAEAEGMEAEGESAAPPRVTAPIRPGEQRGKKPLEITDEQKAQISEEFLNYRANPDTIPGDTPEQKLASMILLGSVILDRELTQEEKASLLQEITGGTGR